MLDESSLSNNKKIESDRCEVEDNDINVASYNDFSQIRQGENELSEVLDFCNSYSSYSESDGSVLDDQPENISFAEKIQSWACRNRSSRIQLQQLIVVLQ